MSLSIDLFDIFFKTVVLSLHVFYATMAFFSMFAYMFLPMIICILSTKDQLHECISHVTVCHLSNNVSDCQLLASTRL